MFNWLFGDSDGGVQENEKQEEDKPQYLEENWPCLMVPLNDEDTVKLRLRENGLDNYGGPIIDSCITYCPPTCHMFFFEDVEDLRRAAAVIWKSDTNVSAVDVTGEGKVLNEATEINDFVRNH